MARTITDEQRLEIAQAIYDRVEGNSGDFGVANEDELAEYLEKADDLLAALPNLYYIKPDDAGLLSEACWEYANHFGDHANQYSEEEQDEEEYQELMDEFNKLRDLATSF